MNKNILKLRNFILPTYIFSIVQKHNLGLHEFLLLVYFLNGDTVLDIQSIKSDLKMTDQDVMLAVNTLMSKKLIRLETKKDNNGKKEEFINLDSFYEEVLTGFSEEEKETTKTDIFSIFETEFGRTITSMEYEIIRAWIEKGFTEEIILGALKEAVYNGVSNLRYIDKILHEWQRKGYKTMRDVSNHNGSSIVKDEPQDLFDYNWLDDDNE